VINSGPFTVGDSGVQLFAETLDADLNPVAVSAGSVKWTTVSGASHLRVTKDGVATALAVGTTTVNATVDGLVSPDAVLSVQDGTVGPDLQTINLSVATMVYNAASGKVWAAVMADD